MSGLVSPLLEALGVEHGLGVPPEEASARGVCLARQVHGTRLRRAPGPGPEVEADALWTQTPGTAVGVVSADCVPLLIAHPAGRFVAAVHAGWRGSADGIAGRVVVELARITSLAPGDLAVAVGPHIGPCCYEVDDPVRERIDDPGVFAAARRAGHYMLDLYELNRRQLERAGALRVERVGGCTACDPAGWPSHRRDASGARMLHWVRLGGR